MHGTAWSSERDKELTARHAKGESYSAIAEAMGITKSAAVGRARRMGLAIRGNFIKEFWTPEKDRELVMLVSQGLSRPEIGAKLGYTSNAVTARLHRIRRRAKRPIKSPEKHVGNIEVLAPEPRRPREKRKKRPVGGYERVAGGCQWIVDEPDATDDCKCLAATLKRGEFRSPYCEYHHDMAFKKEEPKEPSPHPAPRPELRTDYA